MYLYEMHQHMTPCSACGEADPRDLVRVLSAQGFSGVVITDHFYHGNTGIKRTIPWADFVRHYEEAYEIAKEEGDRLDFDVLFGIEDGVGGGKEVLLYGITPQVLYDNPDWPDYGLKEISEATREAGGLVFQAHPFRARHYISDPLAEIPCEYLDGIETHNAGNAGELEDQRAVLLARREGLLCSAGSDGHEADRVGGRYGIWFPDRVRTEAELVQAFLAGGYELKTTKDLPRPNQP